jgi:hypothetical protein
MVRFSVYILTFATLMLTACKSSESNEPHLVEFWKNRSVEQGKIDTLNQASSYLSVYSEIYSNRERMLHQLTVTIGMRNTSSLDTIYIMRADYFNTQGDLIKSYFEKAIYIAPLETVEIVLGQNDDGGGTGGNFVFEWAASAKHVEPLFEAVMISTSGQQGISFVTQGQKR